jgi:GT2 family glycosyltransferase
MTVSLVTYRHSLDQVRPVVEAVLRSSCVEKFFVVDNSGDGPLRGELAREFPSVEYIPLANPGFGAAHNAAMRRAQEGGATIHAVVNPDIDFKPGTLETIESFFRENPDVGLVMPKTVNVDGSMQYNCRLLPTPFDMFGRRFLPKAWTARRRFVYEMRGVDHEKTFDCGYLCGCFLVFRLACLKEVGMFDERFFMYPEDIDISRRVYASRWRSVYCPKATVVHAHEAASYKSWRMTRVHVWNMVKYFNKWGWLFDRGRRRINADMLALVRGAASAK